MVCGHRIGRDVAMNEIGWGMTVPSWVGIVSRCSSQPPNGVNSGFYCNEKVDELLKQAVATKDKDQHAKSISKRTEL